MWIACLGQRVQLRAARALKAVQQQRGAIAFPVHVLQRQHQHRLAQLWPLRVQLGQRCLLLCALQLLGVFLDLSSAGQESCIS